MSEMASSMGSLVEILANIFVFFMGTIALLIVILFVVDIMQSRDAVRRNYPVIGRLRYILSDLGEFFRQYFFAMDREELPFNRAERSWAYRAAKKVDTTIAFGPGRGGIAPGTSVISSDFDGDTFTQVYEDGTGTCETIDQPVVENPTGEDPVVINPNNAGPGICYMMFVLAGK